MTVYPRLDNIFFSEAKCYSNSWKVLKIFAAISSCSSASNLYVMFKININLAVHWQEVDSSKFGKGRNTLLNVSSLY